MTSVLDFIKSIPALVSGNGWKALVIGAAAMWLIDHGAGSLVAGVASSVLGLN